ncbi:H+-transporting two-sector ATPase, delta/epsilon subunit [Mesomycoplasma hyorhinis HUB-1]|uniref:ATPase n=1 Tax=Mesomycoplasma hyorhinis TaxID=2100 RepID=UPI0001E132DE|nr:ATPase [Mesomycoplasma hyorhinis]ADM21693.1 H+-transporting two-sector ATPase, delta/epsilon subunit [Mesomycoplasma hyorhinis HUB-1]MXR38848.1 ATPase [Mesomycoplasma hyorhinis]
MKLTHLKIITPSGIFLETDTDLVTLRTTEGYKGCQYGQNPFVASLVADKLFIGSDKSNTQKVYDIYNGLVYVEEEYTTIFTDKIEEVTSQFRYSDLKSAIKS